MEPRANGRILFIEDEENLLNSLSFILEGEGFTVCRSSSGEEALEAIDRFLPDLVLLDIALPGMDGFEVAEKLRDDPRTREVAIVMLTGRAVEDDIVQALEKWADDYIVKPVRPRVLIARLTAVLRRKAGETAGPTETIVHGPLTIDPTGRTVTVKETPISLTRSEFDILLLLAKSAGAVFSRSGIIEALHGEGYFVTERAIDFQICGLRKKLGICGDCIETVRGVGYKFTPLP